MKNIEENQAVRLPKPT